MPINIAFGTRQSERQRRRIDETYPTVRPNCAPVGILQPIIQRVYEVCDSTAVSHHLILRISGKNQGVKTSVKIRKVMQPYDEAV